MNQFLLLLRRIYFTIMFIALELIAFSYYSNNSVYVNAKVIDASNVLMGHVHSGMADVGSYFRLKRDNEALLARVAELENMLESYRVTEALRGHDSTYTGLAIGEEQYSYMTAHVVNNSINRKDNYITLDKGMTDGVVRDMAILSDGCLVGYVVACSDRYSVGLSFLNSKFVTSGQSEKKGYYGSVRWDGLDYSKGKLLEVPKYADIEVGDTITTTEFSSRFPAGIPIGVVTEVEMVNGINYEARLDMFVRFGGLYNVELISSRDVIERLTLERAVTGEPEDYEGAEADELPAVY